MNKFLRAFIICISTISLQASAQVGTLDPSFGTGGKVTTDFGATQIAYNVVIQSDGKLVAGGLSYNEAILLARYETDGTPDSTYGVNGQVNIPYNVNVGGIYGTGMAIQPDDKILIAAYTGNDSILLVRFETNGLPDPSFGSGGFIKVYTGFSTGARISVALQDSGKIIVYFGLASNSNDIALARFTSTGNLDNTFGNNGIVSSNFTSDYTGSVAIQPDGKILVSGAYVVSSAFRMMLVRYTYDGILDTTFSTDGFAEPFLGNLESLGHCVILQSDGKIIVAGKFNVGMAMARYHPDGTIDSTFGNYGLVVAAFNGISDCYAIGLQQDGKIILGGVLSSPSTNLDFCAARYNSNGILDTSFNSIGYVSTDFATAYDFALSLVIQPDGKIVLAGEQTGAGNVHNFALARYLGDVTVGINESQNSDLKIFISPNPFSDKLNLKTTGVREIKLYDLAGKIIFDKKINSAEISLSTENLSPGYYLLQADDGKQVSYFKIVKQQN